MSTGSRWLGMLLVSLCGCGGVSEQRMSSLEAEVNALRDRQASGGDAAASLKLDVDKRIGELQQEQKALEDRVAAMGQGGGGASAPAPAPASTTTPIIAGAAGSTDDAWMLATEALGAPAEPQVQVDADTYKVSRDWLVEELRQAIAQKQLPKVAPDKKTGGVSIKGVKAKSLAEHLGLKSNDVILEVSGHATPTPTDLLAALKAAGPQARVKLVRKGAEVVQTYTLAD